MTFATDYDFDFLDITRPPAADDPVVLRREQFAQACASITLEGINADAPDFEIQEAIATGALLTDEAVVLYRTCPKEDETVSALKQRSAYGGTPIRKNEADARNLTALEQFECGVTTIRIQALREKPVRGNYDLAHLQAIHQQIFKDIYPWAGICSADVAEGTDDERTLLILKESIVSNASRIAATIKDAGYLRGLDKAQFAAKLVEVYAGLNEMHLFHAGNGLTIREFIWQLAKAGGYQLDYSKVSKQAWDEAVRQLANSNLTPMGDMFYKMAIVERAEAFEKLPWHKALAKHPELDGAYKMLIDAQYAGQNVNFLRAEIIQELQNGYVVGDGVLMEESRQVIDHAAVYRNLRVLDARSLRRQYRGIVVAVSSHHVLLKINDTIAVRYERRKLDHTVHTGDHITIIQHTDACSPPWSHSHNQEIVYQYGENTIGQD